MSKDVSNSIATPPASPGKSRMALLGTVLGPFIALAVVVLFFGIADSLQSDGGGFLTRRNVQNLSVQTVTIAVAALGMTVIIIAGGIDLSAGTALALCACVMAWSLKEDVATLIVCGDNVAGATAKLNKAVERAEKLPVLIERANTQGSEGREKSERLLDEQTQLASQIPKLEEHRERIEQGAAKYGPATPTVAVIICVTTGCLCGLINGALISYLRVVPFIVTLGTMTVFLGIAKLLADNTTIRPEKATQVPEWLVRFTSIRKEALWFGFPTGIWLALLLAVLLAVILRYTVFSRYVFAIGSNELTARLCGINVGRYKMALYMLAGFFFGVAGVYQFSRLSVGNPTSGSGLELQIIAAVVIGGGSLSGGRGSVLGTLTGAAIIFVITGGCTQLGFGNAIQDIILGVIIIAAVAIDQIRQRRLAA